MIIIGEKINGSIPSVAEAIANRDAELIKQRAIAQANAGATFIDCCASVPEAEEVETLKLLDGYVDIYLPDFKYWNPRHAKRYSFAEDYPEKARAALAEMVRQTGEPKFDDNGMMIKGVIVRHLLLPGCLEDAKRIVSYLYNTYGNDIYVSLMNQYTPLASLDAELYPELNQKVKKKVYDWLVDYAVSIGVTQAYIQEGNTAEESFIPPFTLEGV